MNTPPAIAAPTAAAQPTLASLLEKYVSVTAITNTSSHFRYDGICTKCGWHTMQIDEQAALVLVRQHVQQHWRDVTNQIPQ